MVQAICSDSPWQVKAISILGGCFYEQKKYDPTIEAWKNAPLQKRPPSRRQEKGRNVTSSEFSPTTPTYRDVQNKLEALEA